MQDRKERRSLWWFAGGVAAGLAGYLAIRYPVETGTKLGKGLLVMLGASFREAQWAHGTVSYVMVGRGTTPLVFVHGIGDSPESYGLLARRLLDDYRICIPVLPGHPGTSAPPDLQIGHMVQALDTVILREFGPQRVHMLGNSLGGWVAALFASAASERLASLMLVNPAGLHSIFTEELVRPRDEQEAGIALRAIFGRAANRFPRFWLRSFAHAMSARSDPAVARMMAQSPPLDEPLSRITARTTVVVGEYDRLVPPDQSLRAAELIGHAAVEVIPHGSHLPHLTDTAALGEIVNRHTNEPHLLE